MADGLNDARAMRVAEVMNDFRTIQHRISQYRASPSQGEYHEAGFGILRQCHAEAQAVLATHFDAGSASSSGSSGEQTKRQLQRILVDASARRFRVQKIYLKAVAAMRWVSTRTAILRGQKPNANHRAALQQAENALRAELASITDERIVNELRQKDWSAGHYLAEDPSLATLQSWIRSQQ
ncbi:hypothetical protein MMC19_001314 [Ptychographa xylographoides]|nr:hypothetical protein [Ptychographa xylographoides]